MLKKELEMALKVKEQELENLKSKIDKGLRKVIDNTCWESHEHIETFCGILGIDFPKEKITVEIRYGSTISEIYDKGGDQIDFTIK